MSKRRLPAQDLPQSATLRRFSQRRPNSRRTSPTCTTGQSSSWTSPPRSATQPWLQPAACSDAVTSRSALSSARCSITVPVPWRSDCLDACDDVDLAGRAQADRQGKHGSLAEKYAGSELKRANMRELEKHLTCRVELPPSVLKDFNSTSETSNSWWWITWVLLQVWAPPAPRSHISACAVDCRLRGRLHGHTVEVAGSTATVG